MALVFISKEHEEKFMESLKKAESTHSNVHMQVALYVLTAVPNLANKLDLFVNFKGRYVTPEGVNRANLSEGERVMAGLAINLFNGHELNGLPSSPVNQMALVDKALRKVYLSALEYRFF
jgi:hypothetical protein